MAADPPAGIVAISHDFPGGNIKVTSNTAGNVQLEPDLRGDRPWFYWCFAATVTKPGQVAFTFPEKVAGFKDGGIGFQGPAVSTDGGTLWDWLGTETVDGSTFTYDFAKAGEAVRFAVSLPYVETDLQRFLKQHKQNPHLQTRVLTKSRGGREVELLQIGKPGPGVLPLLMTCRHHANENVASYVVEGWLAEAMSDSAEAREFREHYVLFCVPFVDKDGVEAGDQGKNRKPHDHNRDYNETSLYPEVQAIKELDAKQKFRFALDVHCPTLVMQDHQVMYFVGAKKHPPYNEDNVREFSKWIKQALPKDAPHGPLVWLRDENDPSPKNSRYFGFKPRMIMSATLEVPFAPPGKKTDPASLRNYGRLMLHAWVNTHFVSADENE